MSLKMRMTLLGSLAVLLAMALPIDLSGANGNFVPDWTFKGSALTDWQPIGQADWRAENGEIVGTPTNAEGGWLVLNQSFQDVQLAASFRCAGACKPGVLDSSREDAGRWHEGHSGQLRADRHGRVCDQARCAGQGDQS